MFTDEQIKNEIRRRADAEEKRRKAEVSFAIEQCSKHIDTLSEFIHEHEFASCSDSNRVNVDRGCNRCIALQVKCEYVEAVAHVRLVKVT
jgi:hypothetical protein